MNHDGASARIAETVLGKSLSSRPKEAPFDDY